MKYHQIISTLMEEPLLITPAAHASLVKLFEEHRALSASEFLAKREGVDMCGQAIELEQMEVIEGIAHIPVGGPIGRGLGKFEKGAGAVDVDDIEEDLDQAEADPLVYAAVLDIDSPGGMVNGTPELAERILQFEKPVYAYSAGMMCSAAYWLACACDRIFATRTAAVGSIGVYAALLDVSERFKQEGIRMELFTSGKHKGAGIPGTSLTKDQREHLQGRVNELAEMFYDAVRASREDVLPQDMQGQAFTGTSAREKGLVDEVVRTKDEVVQELMELQGV